MLPTVGPSPVALLVGFASCFGGEVTLLANAVIEQPLTLALCIACSLSSHRADLDLATVQVAWPLAERVIQAGRSGTVKAMLAVAAVG